MTPGAARSLAWVLIGSVLMAACAGAPRSAQPVAVPAKPPLPTGEPDCFYARDVQNFRVLDRSNLILYAPNEAHAFRISISPPSPELRFTDSLAFRPASGRICGYAGDRLVVGAGASPDVVAIINVYRLSRESLDALRPDREGNSVTPAQPQPGPGADVEGVAGESAPEPAGENPGN